MDSQNQMSYFTSFCYVGYTGYHVSFNLTFWLKQDAFRLVFDHMQKLKFYDQKKKHNTTTFRVHTWDLIFLTSNQNVCIHILKICKTKRTILFVIKLQINFVAFVTGITAIIMGMTDSYLVSNWYDKKGWNYFYNDLQQRSELLFVGMIEQTAITKIFVPFFTYLQILILIPSVVLVPYLDLFVLLVPLCVRRIMREFSKFCKNSMGSPVAAQRVI